MDASWMQDGMDEHLETAYRFVDGNMELRDALGLPSDARIELHPLGRGEHNTNFWFWDEANNRKLVLRVNHASQIGRTDQATYEFCALQELMPSTRTPLPLYLDDTRERISHGVLVISFEEGAWLDFDDDAQVHEAAAILADIHSVTPEPNTFLMRPGDPLKAQFEECLGYVKKYRASGLEEPFVISYVERFIKATEKAIRTTTPHDANHIINTEAIPSHFLMPDGAGTHGIRGHMVDWEKPIIGEVEQDVAYFLSPTTTIWDTDFIFSREQRSAFIRQYWKAVDGRFAKGDFAKRFPAYVMSNCLRGITWCCGAVVDYRDDARPLKTDRTRELLKVYLSQEYLEQVWQDCYLHHDEL